jgi:DNA-binding NarL/FixJ family response regulator
VRVVIGEDEALMREGLVLLMRQAGFTVAGAAADADELLRLVDEHRPDLVLTDIRMPPLREDDGLRAAIAVRTRHPAIGVVVLSQYVHRRYAQELLGDAPAGVGYLLKQRVGNVESFCRDVQAVAEGGTVLDPDVVASMLARARQETHALDRLTPRQREVLALIAEGRSNLAIARQFGIAEKSVVHHVSRLYDVLGLPVSEDDHRRVLAVVQYLSR